tara:strand:- start:332 stop:490 length:159 start_codon:yes stop_codon:yes gene_type:complete
VSSTQAARNKRHKDLNAERDLKTVAVVVPVDRTQELKDIAAKMREEAHNKQG